MKKDGQKSFKPCCTTVKKKKPVSRANQFNSIKDYSQ